MADKNVVETPVSETTSGNVVTNMLKSGTEKVKQLASGETASTLAHMNIEGAKIGVEIEVGDTINEFMLDMTFSAFGVPEEQRKAMLDDPLKGYMIRMAASNITAGVLVTAGEEDTIWYTGAKACVTAAHVRSQKNIGLGKKLRALMPTDAMEKLTGLHNSNK